MTLMTCGCFVDKNGRLTFGTGIVIMTGAGDPVVVLAVKLKHIEQRTLQLSEICFSFVAWL